jgi:hypothetical protein
MIGAVATAVLDFLANFVLQRIMAAGRRVGDALKKTAGKIVAQLKRAAAATKKVAGKAMSAAKRAGRSAVGAVKSAGSKAAAAVKSTVKKAGRAVAKTKVGKAVVAGTKAVGRGARKVIDKGKKALAKRKQKAAAKKKKAKKKKETPQEKLNRVVAIISPRVTGWFRGAGAPSLWLKTKLQAVRIRHRLSALTADRSGDRVTVNARVNPRAAVTNGRITNKTALRNLIYDEVDKFVKGFGLRDPIAPLQPVQGAEHDPIEDVSKRPMEGFVDRPDDGSKSPMKAVETRHKETAEYPMTEDGTGGKSSIEVKGPGTGTYQQMTGAMERESVRATGLTGDDATRQLKMMNYVRALIRNRRSRKGLLDPKAMKTVEGFGAVFGDAELGRSPIAEFHTMAAVEMAGAGKNAAHRTTFRELFSSYADQARGWRRKLKGGIFPPSQSGAENAMERAWREQTDPGSLTALDRQMMGRRKDREFRRREREFLARWARFHMARLNAEERAKKRVIQNDEQMRELVREQLIKWRPGLQRQLAERREQSGANAS